MSASNFLEAAILDHIFGESVYTAPTWYVALSTADPTEDGSGIAEPSDAAYARVAMGATTRTVSSVANDADITFPVATESWGTITHFALFDAASGGNMLTHSALASEIIAVSGDTLNFAAGELTVTQD